MITKDKYSFEDLVEIMTVLRGKNGCPWDSVQTHQSLKKYLLEEAYEAIEAVDIGGLKLADELGDILLQVVFHAQIAKDEGTFDITEVTTQICKKMISRHPHIFGIGQASTPEEVTDNWDAIKRKERGFLTHTETMKDISKELPALMRAYKVQQKAAKVGFDWEDISGAFSKVKEEIEELQQAVAQNKQIDIEDETGDLLFAMVNVARFLKVQPELALEGSIKKFINRFDYIEKMSISKGKTMEEMTLVEMDELWEEAKTRLILG